MSRNSNRTGSPVQTQADNQTTTDNQVPVASPPTPQPQLQPQGQNPFGLSFVIPTEFVELPSRGKFYGENHPLCGLKQVEMKQMTAKEEDILVNKSYIESGEVFDRLLDSLLITENVSPRSLLAGDKDALLMHARRSGYGDSFEVSAICTNCKEEARFTYDLSKCRIVEDNYPEGVVFDPIDGFFGFVLPKSEIEVKIQLLSGVELDYLDQQRNKKTELKLETNDTIDFLRKTIVEANGITDPSLLERLAVVLPAIDSRKVRVMHSKLMPSLDTTQAVECSNCAARIESEVQFDLNFFWPDL